MKRTYIRPKIKEVVLTRRLMETNADLRAESGVTFNEGGHTGQPVLSPDPWNEDEEEVVSFDLNHYISRHSVWDDAETTVEE